MIDSGEECDGGRGCLSNCLCNTNIGFEVTSPATTDCQASESSISVLFSGLCVFDSSCDYLCLFLFVYISLRKPEVGYW